MNDHHRSSGIRGVIVLLMIGIVVFCGGVAAGSLDNIQYNPEPQVTMTTNNSVTTPTNCSDNGTIIEERKIGPGLPPKGWITNSNLSDPATQPHITPAVNNSVTPTTNSSDNGTIIEERKIGPGLPPIGWVTDSNLSDPATQPHVTPTANNSVTPTTNKTDNGTIIEERKIGPGLPPEGWVTDSNLSDVSNISPDPPDRIDVPTLLWSYLHRLLQI